MFYCNHLANSAALLAKTFVWVRAKIRRSTSERAKGIATFLTSPKHDLCCLFLQIHRNLNFSVKHNKKHLFKT